MAKCGAGKKKEGEKTKKEAAEKTEKKKAKK